MSQEERKNGKPHHASAFDDFIDDLDTLKLLSSESSDDFLYDIAPEICVTEVTAIAQENQGWLRGFILKAGFANLELHLAREKQRFSVQWDLGTFDFDPSLFDDFSFRLLPTLVLGEKDPLSEEKRRSQTVIIMGMISDGNVCRFQTNQHQIDNKYYEILDNCADDIGSIVIANHLDLKKKWLYSTSIDRTTTGPRLPKMKVFLPRDAYQHFNSSLAGWILDHHSQSEYIDSDDYQDQLAESVRLIVKSEL